MIVHKCILAIPVQNNKNIYYSCNVSSHLMMAFAKCKLKTKHSTRQSRTETNLIMPSRMKNNKTNVANDSFILVQPIGHIKVDADSNHTKSALVMRGGCKTDIDSLLEVLNYTDCMASHGRIFLFANGTGCVISFAWLYFALLCFDFKPIVFV